MNKIKLLIIGGVLIVFALGAAQFLSPRQAVSPTLPVATSTPSEQVSTTTAPITTTATVSITKKPVADSLPIVAGDSIASWDFRGAYTDNPELVAKAQTEIKRLSDLLNTATSSAMILSVGIANQYELLGDGKKQYEYLERAIRANPKNGLPWHNLGVLMERLGAYATARAAYEESTLVQPELKFYHYAYIEFLTARMKDDAVNIEKAFEFAENSVGQTPYLLELRMQWQKS